jgi:ribosomal protein S27E
MNIKCNNCRTVNSTPTDQPDTQYQCYKCGAFLPKSTAPSGETSEAVGMIGGAALGAAIGGPLGAIVGGILGAVLGKSNKGVG